jgi:DNA-binding GntR family transcriptional regulator
VSVPTVRQAYGVLEQEGMIVRKHGVGTFVAETPTVTLDGLRASLSTWLTQAMSIEPGPSVFDLGDLRDWIDGGCAGDMPMPETKE